MQNATQINGHFINTCSLADLDHVVQFLKITPAQTKKALSKGASALRAYVGTKLGNYLSASGVEFFTMADLPSDLANAKKQAEAQPKAEPKAEPKSNPFASASTGKTRSKLSGAYVVLKRGLTASADSEKWQIWTPIYECTTFEEVFARAPAKVVKGKTIATPATELAWALKKGWIAQV
jgi:hypothetical protein